MKPIKKMNNVSHTAGASRAGVKINATGEESCCSSGITADDELDPKLNNKKSLIDAAVEEGQSGGLSIQCIKMENKYLNIGTWNIRTLNELGKLHLLLLELEQQKIDITGLAETQWKGKSHFMSSNNADEGGQSGVVIVLN